MPSSEPGSRVGSLFGPYRLLRLLGRGGMGEVYEAEDTRKHRVVALKLISPHVSADPVFRERMQREADAAGRLTEPHAVPIHDYGEIGGQLYLDMRLIDGVSLHSMMAAEGPLTPARAVAIVRQVAAVLDAAHASGVTHRDVKPENILITDNDFAYLVDFGIARAFGDPGLTQTGTAMGTYHYMAPERFTADEVSYRTDIYALACVLSECLTGGPPYRANSLERIVAAHLLEPPPQPSQLRPGMVPMAFDQVIAQGMAKHPEHRFRTAGDLAAAAHEALTAPERQHEATTLQHGDNPTLAAHAADSGPAGVRAPFAVSDVDPLLTRSSAVPAAPAPGAETMAGPMAPDISIGRWRKPRLPYTAGSSRPLPFSTPLRAAEPTFTPGTPRARRRSKLVAMIGAAALLLITAIGVAGYLGTHRATPAKPASGQSVLSFTGLNLSLTPGGVAVDGAGNVYVTNQGMYGRVVKLAAGTGNATLLPFTGLYEPQGVAVDSAGSVYVTDFNNRVLKLTAGSHTPTELPFTGLNYPEGVEVDAEGSVYVADRGNSRVVTLAAGSSSQVVLPFDGLKNPDDVAIDTAGTVYVTDSDNNRVVKLTSGSTAQSVLPFTGFTLPWGIAVDTGGNVYVTDQENNEVVRLAAGSNTQTVLPFTGLNTPLAVTVDHAGNVYVADRGNGRVVKLTG